MNRTLLLLSLLVAIASCKSPAPVDPSEYDEPWNMPTINAIATDFKYYSFGRIGYDDREYKEDTLLIPPITGLIHHSQYVLCPEDTCFAEYAFIALRCPENQVLQDWVSGKVCDYANSCAIGARWREHNEINFIIKKKSFETVEQTCRYYLDELGKVYDDWVCPGHGDRNVRTLQGGLLITDCWRSGDLFTFYMDSWIDDSNTCHEEYFTVDSRNGKVLTLQDLVSPLNYKELASKMMSHLMNSNGTLILKNKSYKDLVKELPPTSWLEDIDGAALIREGLILYSHPYHMGFGYEGQYEAIIPYDELKGVLRKGIAVDLENN